MSSQCIVTNVYTLILLRISPTVGLSMQYNWVQNLQAIFGSAGVDDIEGDEPILLITPLYFQSLSSALQGVDTK